MKLIMPSGPKTFVALTYNVRIWQGLS